MFWNLSKKETINCKIIKHRYRGLWTTLSYSYERKVTENMVTYLFLTPISKTVKTLQKILVYWEIRMDTFLIFFLSKPPPLYTEEKKTNKQNASRFSQNLFFRRYWKSLQIKRQLLDRTKNMDWSLSLCYRNLK